MITFPNLAYFVKESLFIEGINREPTQDELEATEHFLGLLEISVLDVVSLGQRLSARRRIA